MLAGRRESRLHLLSAGDRHRRLPHRARRRRTQTRSDRSADGESLLPLLQQTGPLQRTAVYFHYPNYAFHQRNRLGGAIREGDFKLIRNYDDNSLELYNLATDLGETRNLAATQPDVSRRLSAALETWLKSSGAGMPAAAAPKP